MERATFWQLTVDANDPVRLSAFWAAVLGYATTPAAEPDTSWNRHYRARLERSGRPAYRDRIFDPEGVRPPIWFQHGPRDKIGKNRLHLDLYPTGRNDDLPIEDRIALVEAEVARVVRLGATVVDRTRQDDPQDSVFFVVMNDPEGNEFCLG